MANKTTKAPFDFKVGDWCKSYEKGFFRIEQIIPLVVNRLDVLRDEWAVEFYKSADKEYHPRYSQEEADQLFQSKIAQLRSIIAQEAGIEESTIAPTPRSHVDLDRKSKRPAVPRDIL